MLSMHTSPLVQPGAGDSGGMNVYVRELVSALAQAGVDSTTYVRRWRARPARRGGRRARLPGRPHRRRPTRPPQGGLCRRRRRSSPPASSTTSTHPRRRRPHPRQLLAVGRGRPPASSTSSDLPLVCTFHTLARVKAEGGDAEPAWRELAEMEIIGCADAICVSCTEEERSSAGCTATRRGGSRSWRRASSTPSSRPVTARGPRRAGPRPRGPIPVLLFVGRIQPLKGVDVAVRALAALGRPDAVAGHRRRRQRSRRRRRGREAGRARRRARPHRAGPLRAAAAPPPAVQLLPRPPTSCWCRAGRRASASSPWRRRRAGRRSWPRRVGGLLTLVDHGHTGFLVAGPRPRGLRRLHRRDPRQRPAGGGDGRARGRSARSATRGRSPRRGCAALYGDLTVGALVDCT